MSLALDNGNKNIAELLHIILHIILKRDQLHADDDVVKLFFKISKQVDQLMHYVLFCNNETIIDILRKNDADILKANHTAENYLYSLMKKGGDISQNNLQLVSNGVDRMLSF
uniref:Uncharacterized protein n=1 Tax=Trichogramma kaykai TaxID=54128 RepID=A0ABD2WVB8_9HYME